MSVSCVLWVSADMNQGTLDSLLPMPRMVRSPRHQKNKQPHYHPGQRSGTHRPSMPHIRAGGAGGAEDTPRGRIARSHSNPDLSPRPSSYNSPSNPQLHKSFSGHSSHKPLTEEQEAHIQAAHDSRDSRATRRRRHSGNRKHSASLTGLMVPPPAKAPGSSHDAHPPPPLCPANRSRDIQRSDSSPVISSDSHKNYDTWSPDPKSPVASPATTAAAQYIRGGASPPDSPVDAGEFVDAAPPQVQYRQAYASELGVYQPRSLQKRQNSMGVEGQPTTGSAKQGTRQEEQKTETWV